MTDVKRANEQLQTLLNIEHIRRHLIKVGLIDQHGEVVSKVEYERTHKRRSRRRHTSNKNVEGKRKHHPLENIENSKQHRQSKSPGHHSMNQRAKSASVSQSRQKNKSQSPTRLSSPNQSIRVKSVLMRRTVSPKINPITGRCLVTMIYYGPKAIVDYERNWFVPEGDEIIVMQQHCGGENLVVYKGALKPNETFDIESRRHSDYPFALTFYVNGIIDNRLSICCESRYKHNVRIGGKRGVFGIINVQKSKACRRCRFEQRIKKLAESKGKNKLSVTQISTPESNLTRPTSPEPPITRLISLEDQQESPLDSPIKSDQPLDTNNSRNIYSPDFDIPEEKIHPVISTAYDNKIRPSENNFNHQRRTSTVSTENDSDNEITTITDQSNTDFEKTFAETN